ncbi:hypothetical protein AVEN_218876-1 [Araneus ventricosus]|uniref:Uncharacterized protein n=1 Tax=Araneus ventricosus TaxID=182803 RepID=A0A4Y2LVS5_ARAVE|nr:hypothetical protein AVEN_19505-1 [Araneus ventricosus]GBN17730.1 hypothetical protein AVEN_218876-1 [Araneus ventricosus]
MNDVLKNINLTYDMLVGMEFSYKLKNSSFGFYKLLFNLSVLSRNLGIDFLPTSSRPRWPVVRSWLWGRMVPGSKPIPLQIRRVWDLLHAKMYVAKRPPVGVAWKFGEGVPDQESSSSSDRGS